MGVKEKLLYANNWNIGFCEQTSHDLISGHSLKTIQWMKHPYKDRWFADPFIYQVTENEIVVFVEECPIENPKGILCELVLDRKNKRLKQRYVLLELDTHLSYPAIIREGDKVYVYPENGASGKLDIYEYDEAHHCLTNPVCILEKAVADATIMKKDGRYILIATHNPETQKNAYLYESQSLFGPFCQISKDAFQPLISCARPGGNWIQIGDDVYRPAQNCEIRYGASLNIMSCKFIGREVSEKKAFAINPINKRYNLGIHTLNFHQDICVVDGYGYLYPLYFRLYKSLRTIFHVR